MITGLSASPASFIHAEDVASLTLPLPAAVSLGSFTSRPKQQPQNGGNDVTPLPLVPASSS